MNELDELLREIGRQRRQTMPPPPPLAAGVGLRSAGRRPSGVWWTAAAVFAFGLVWFTAGSRPPQPEPARASVAPTPPAVAEPLPFAPPAPPPKRALAARRLPASPPAQVFRRIPGSEAWPAPQAAMIVQAELTSATLARYGIAAPGTMPVQILIGEDGLARAIRLLQ